MIIAGIITFSTRFSMFNKSIAKKMPTWVETPLHYVPTALLTAIIVPEVLRPYMNNIEKINKI